MQNWVIYSFPNQNGFKTIIPNDTEKDCFTFQPFEKQFPTIAFKGEEQAIELNNCKYPLDFKNSDKTKSTTQITYKKGFDIIKQAIIKGEVSKVILSKLVVKPFDSTNTFQLIQQLRNQFPSAFIYCVNHQETGSWIGATPELLLKEGEGIANTVALAGTKMTEEIKWTNKEYEEQNIVRNYIEEVMTKLGLSYQVSPLETIQSGKLFHLMNKIKIKLNNNSDLLGIINLLHPTPAIAGLPKEKSLDVIKKAEDHYRKYYCGVIGVTNKDISAYYVNLRCGQVQKNSITAYAGGGITSDSDFEAEWIESTEKSKSLLGLI